MASYGVTSAGQDDMIIDRDRSQGQVIAWTQVGRGMEESIGSLNS